jgi:hypothetical protein
MNTRQIIRLATDPLFGLIFHPEAVLRWDILRGMVDANTVLFAHHILEKYPDQVYLAATRVLAGWSGDPATLPALADYARKVLLDELGIEEEDE